MLIGSMSSVTPPFSTRSVALFQVLVEREAVCEARAAAALHEHAQLQIGVRLLTDQLADLGGRGIGEDQAGRGAEARGETGNGGFGSSWCHVEGRQRESSVPQAPPCAAKRCQTVEL